MALLHVPPLCVNLILAPPNCGWPCFMYSPYPTQCLALILAPPHCAWPCLMLTLQLCMAQMLTLWHMDLSLVTHLLHPSGDVAI